METYYLDGKKEKAWEMAIMMLEAGKPLPKIIKYTGLLASEIEKLK